MRFVPQLGRIHALANGVMTHIMRTGFDIETLQEALTRHSIGQRSSRVSLERRNNEILHNLDFSFPLQAGLRLTKWGFRFWDIEPGFIFTQTHLDITDALKVFIKFF